MLSASPVFFEKFDLLHDGKLNNAAAVLFGRDFYFYPQCLLRMARFKGTIKDEFIDNQRITGNIYTLLDAAMAFFFKHLSLSGKIEGLYREEELSVPYKAMRECCINAFAHRFYHDSGTSVSIAIYDDRIEITNSGHQNRIFLMYSDGVMPSCFLNIRLKCWGYSKPRRSDTCEMVSPEARPFLASWMTN